MYDGDKGGRKEKIMVELFFCCSRRALVGASSHKVRRKHLENRLFNYQKKRQDKTVPPVKRD